MRLTAATAVMRPARFGTRAGLAALGVALAMLLPGLAAPARAEIAGNCAASIRGVDVGGLSSGDPAQAVAIDQGSSVAVRLQAPAPLTRTRVQLEFAGFRWTVLDEPTGGTSWQETVPVADYARFGVGLYKVIGEGQGAAGTCSGAALVRVAGDPMATAAGMAGAALGAAGILGLLGGTVAAMARATGTALSLGLPGGALAGVGALVLGQQCGVAYPTQELAIGVVGAGLVAGTALPSLVRALRR